MALTGTAEATEAIYTAIISASFKQELGSAVVVAPMARFHDLSGEASGAWDVLKWPNIDASVTTPLAETSDLTFTALNPTSVRITAAEAGIAAELTDRLMNRNVLQEGIAVEIGQYLSRALQRTVESDLCTLFSSFSSSVGTTGTDLDEADILQAIFTIENADGGGGIVGVIPPVMAWDIRKAMTLVATAGTSLATGTIKAGMDMNAIGAMNNGAGGLWTTIYNVPFYITTKCPTSAGDRHGAMFNVGQAIGMAAKFFGRIEFERNASFRTTEICCVSDFGVGEIEDAQGVRLLAAST